jgi:hypothetical protein
MQAVFAMRSLRTAATIAALMVAAPAMASDSEVLACRATETARQAAGKCGAHGCDCGLLKSECAASLKYLNSGLMDDEGAGYQRELYAYRRDCVGK